MYGKSATKPNTKLGISKDAMDLSDFNIYTINLWVLIPVAFIITFLSFLERRKSYHRDCCDGRPALLIPFRFLDGYENRTAYAMAFGTTTSTVISLIISEKTLAIDFPLWAQALYVYLQALIGCLTCFPLFACLTTRYKAVGAIICMLYSMLWLCLNIVHQVKVVQESGNNTVFGTSVLPNDTISLNIARSYQVTVGIPVILCYIVLIGYCVYILHRCFVSKTYFGSRTKPTLRPHQEEHVRWVFRKNRRTVCLVSDDTTFLSAPKTFIDAMHADFKLRLVSSLPFFKYPTRIIALAFVQLNVIYWMSILFLMFTVSLVYQFNTLVLKDRTDFALEVVAIVVTCASLAVIVCIVNSVFQILLVVRSYRYHILRIFQGDRSFIPDVTKSSQYILTKSMAFPGYQVAFLLWGQVLAYVCVLLGTLIIALPMYLLIKLDSLGNVLASAAQLLSFPASVFLFFYLQVFITKRVLLQKKIKETDKELPLNIDNSKLCEIISYYSLFTNMAVGIFSCLWRIMKTAFYGIFSVGRLDRSVFTRDMEKSDNGFEAYICMLLVDNAHNNPSMRVFAHLLWTKILAARFRNNQLEDTFSDSAALTPDCVTRYGAAKSDRKAVETPTSSGSVGNGNHWVFSEPNDCVTSKQARTRWHLALTLIRNPQLRKLRKHFSEGKTSRTATQESVAPIVFIDPAHEQQSSAGEQGKDNNTREDEV